MVFRGQSEQGWHNIQNLKLIKTFQKLYDIFKINAQIINLKEMEIICANVILPILIKVLPGLAVGHDGVVGRLAPHGGRSLDSGL